MRSCVLLLSYIFQCIQRKSPKKAIPCWEHTYNTVMIGVAEETAKGTASRQSKQLKEGEGDRVGDCTQCPNDTNHRKWKIPFEHIDGMKCVFSMQAHVDGSQACDVVRMCVCRVYFTFDLIHWSTGRCQTHFQRVYLFVYAWVCKQRRSYMRTYCLTIS